MANIFTIGIKLSNDPISITTAPPASTPNALEYQFIVSDKLIGLFKIVAAETIYSKTPTSPIIIQPNPRDLLNPNSIPNTIRIAIIGYNLLKVFLAFVKALFKLS